MPTLLQHLEGHVVAYETRSFDGFTDDRGREVPAGTRRSLWIVTQFGEAPAEVSVPIAGAPQCEVLEFGDRVTATCEVRARNDRITLRLANLARSGAAA